MCPKRHSLGKDSPLSNSNLELEPKSVLFHNILFCFLVEGCKRTSYAGEAMSQTRSIYLCRSIGTKKWLNALLKQFYQMRGPTGAIENLKDLLVAASLEQIFRFFTAIPKNELSNKLTLLSERCYQKQASR